MESLVMIISGKKMENILEAISTTHGKMIKMTNNINKAAQEEINSIVTSIILTPIKEKEEGKKIEQKKIYKKNKKIMPKINIITEAKVKSKT